MVSLLDHDIHQRQGDHAVTVPHRFGPIEVIGDPEDIPLRGRGFVFIGGALRSQGLGIHGHGGRVQSRVSILPRLHPVRLTRFQLHQRIEQGQGVGVRFRFQEVLHQ